MPNIALYARRKSIYSYVNRFASGKRRLKRRTAILGDFSMLDLVDSGVMHSGVNLITDSGLWPFPGLDPGAYNLIYADPAWEFATRSPKGRKKCADAHYRCMPLKDMMRLPVGDLAAKDACLFMWATWPMLLQAIELMSAWGFVYKSGGAWAKLTKNGKVAFGTGYRVRCASEPFLLGFRGKVKNSRRHRNVIIAKNREHSRKPDEAFTWVDSYLVGENIRKVELFARTNRPGWQSWGDEVGKFACE